MYVCVCVNCIDEWASPEDVTTSILNAALDSSTAMVALPTALRAMEAQDAAALPQSTAMETQDMEGKIFQLNLNNFFH